MGRSCVHKPAIEVPILMRAAKEQKTQVMLGVNVTMLAAKSSCQRPTLRCLGLAPPRPVPQRSGGCRVTQKNREWVASGQVPYRLAHKLRAVKV